MKQDLFSILMGKHPIGIPLEFMVIIWLISSKYITDIYNGVIKER